MKSKTTSQKGNEKLNSRVGKILTYKELVALFSKPQKAYK